MPSDPPASGAPAARSGRSNPPVAGADQRLAGMPPALLVLLAVLSLQLGAGLATQLFPLLGAQGTVALRIILSAVLLALAAGGAALSFHRAFWQNWRILTLFGVCVASMNMLFYLAIDRIPLGAAVACEFVGPLTVAALNSRKLRHFGWILLAAAGIVLISPVSGTDLDTVGVLYALLAGVGWAMFIVLARRVGTLMPGNDGLAIGMIIAALLMIPFLVPVTSQLLVSPLLLVAGLGVALLSTTIPFVLEFAALKRLPARTYGVLVSIEPGVAALVGVALLGERPGLQEIFAIACIIVAAVGMSVFEDQQ